MTTLQAAIVELAERINAAANAADPNAAEIAAYNAAAAATGLTVEQLDSFVLALELAGVIPARCSN